jgi:hypothetical protein
MKIKSYTELVNPPKFKVGDSVRFEYAVTYKIFKVVIVTGGLYVNYYTIEDDKEIIRHVSENSLEQVPDYEIDAMKYNM